MAPRHTAGLSESDVSLRSQFPSLYHLCGAHGILSSSGRGGDATLPLLCLVVGAEPGQVNRSLWLQTLPAWVAQCHLWRRSPNKDLAPLEYVACWVGFLSALATFPRLLWAELPTPPSSSWDRKLKVLAVPALLAPWGMLLVSSPIPSSTKPPLRTCPEGPPTSLRPPQARGPSRRPVPSASRLLFVPRAPGPSRGHPQSGDRLTRAGDPGAGCAVAPAGRATLRVPPGWRRGPGPAPERGVAASRGEPWSGRTRTSGNESAAARARLSRRRAGGSGREGRGSRAPAAPASGPPPPLRGTHARLPRLLARAPPLPGAPSPGATGPPAGGGESCQPGPGSSHPSLLQAFGAPVRDPSRAPSSYKTLGERGTAAAQRTPFTLASAFRGTALTPGLLTERWVRSKP